MSKINLLAENLDSRVEFKCASPRFYWNKDGGLSIAAANEWPLEYSGGVAIGRHEPEPAATNLQPQSRGDTIGDYLKISGLDSLDVSETGAPDGGTIALIPSSCDTYAMSQDSTGAYLFGPNSYQLTSEWQRLAFLVTSTASSRLRLWLGRNSTSGTPAVFFTQTAYAAAGEYAVSFFARADDDSTFPAGMAQLEKGSLCTSPIITTTATASRSESSVQIDTTDIQSLTVYYSDNTSDVYTTDDDIFILPYSTKNWGERYLQYLELPDTGTVRCMGANGVPVIAVRAGEGQRTVRCLTPGGYTVAVAVAENGQQNAVRCLSAGGYPVWVVRG